MSLLPLVDKLLDRDILRIQLAHRKADFLDQNQPQPENFRFLAYRNLFFMIYGRTKPKMTRIPLPSCIVMKIRTLYPDPNKNYKGFQQKRCKRN
jgi:hypothetical protein